MLYTTSGLSIAWDDVFKDAVEGGLKEAKGLKLRLPERLPFQGLRIPIKVSPGVSKVATGAYQGALVTAKKKYQSELDARAARYRREGELAHEKFPTTPIEQWWEVGTEAVKEPSIMVPLALGAAAILILVRR